MRTSKYNSKKQVKKTNGFSFVEVLIAILIVTACAVPIVYMVTSSRTDTSKAINYLRAVELANEAIEWAQASKFENLTNQYFSGVFGSLVNVSGTGLTPEKILTGIPSNQVWKNDNLMADKLSYSEQYNRAFFWREIDIKNISSAASDFNNGMIKKVTVTIKWNEGKKPVITNNIRMRQVQMSVLVLNDQNLYF